MMRVTAGETTAAEGARPTATSADRAPYLSSIVALALGVVLAVGVSALFGLLGWGGEVASQTAGAASGAAPLIIDGVRQRRVQPANNLRALSRGLFYRPKLWIASALGFAVLLVDTAAGFLVYNLTEGLIRIAHGDSSRTVAVYVVMGAALTIPAVTLGTYFLAVAAGHRLGVHRQRRWVLLGMGIYAVVRGAIVVAADSGGGLGLSWWAIVAGAVVTLPLLILMALLGARRARRTQSSYYVKVYFSRLDPADQEAALALLDEAVQARRG